MTVKLYVDWRENEILTAKQLNEKINERVKNMISDKDSYDEYLKDYLDCNYTKLELFQALIDGDASIKETIEDIRSGVADGIYDWCDMDTRADYEEVKVEV